jgi:hypothetical protein
MMSKYRIIYMPLNYLGSAFVSNILEGNITYKKDLYNRLTGFKTSYDSEDLVIMLSTQTELELSVAEHSGNKYKSFDRLSAYCEQSSNHTSLSKECCNTSKACLMGTFESIFYVMKDSMIPAHVIHKDEQKINFTGNLVELTMPSIINKNLTIFPTISEEMYTTNNDYRQFLNLEPFIPLCKLTNQFNSQNPRWGTTLL